MQVRPRPWVVNGVHTSHDHDAENAAVFALYPIRDQTASLLLMLRIKGRKNRRGSRHFGNSGGDRRSGPASRPPGRTLTGSWLPNGLADGFWLRGREKSSWGVWRDVGSSPWPAESVAQNVLIANTLRRLQTIAKCCTRGRLKILRRSTPNFQGSIEPCSSGD